MKKVPLSQGKFALVDDEDFAKVSRWKWHARRHGRRWYAGRYKNGRSILMHRVINATPAGLDTDHINGNGLDNRKKNLRTCTRSENLANQTRMSLGNTSGARGVTWHKRGHKWQAQIRRNKKYIYLGLFDTVAEASRARKMYERREHESKTTA